jgi:hypothetical protein
VKALFFCLAGLVCACPGLGQVAVLQIRIVEGDGTVHAPGSRSPRPILVEVTDETGRPAAGAAVSFHLPDSGASGTFTNGLRTEVLAADASGRVILRGLQLNRQPGRFQIRITASLEQARAGTVSFQYIAEPKGGAPAPTPVAASPTPSRSGGRKWWIVAVVAGVGAAAAGGMAVRGGSSGTVPAATVAPPPFATLILTPLPAPALTIGTPSIVVGKP